MRVLRIWTRDLQIFSLTLSQRSYQNIIKYKSHNNLTVNSRQLSICWGFLESGVQWKVNGSKQYCSSFWKGFTVAVISLLGYKTRGMWGSQRVSRDPRLFYYQHWFTLWNAKINTLRNLKTWIEHLNFVRIELGVRENGGLLSLVNWNFLLLEVWSD